MTAIEEGSTAVYDRLSKAAAETVELDRVEQIAQSADERDQFPVHFPSRGMDRGQVRIGVAYDRAFCCYYPDNLELLEAEGAVLVKFSPLSDQVLPDVDLLYLGGGYPELYGEALAKNLAMRQAIRAFAERGGAVYAECGGMMYLTQAVRDFESKSHDMVGLFAAEAVMKNSGLTLGYRAVELSHSCILGGPGVRARGHEFHYSTLTVRGPLRYACALSDARGLSKGQDGLVTSNVLALYTHLHFASQPQIAKALVDSARRLAGRISTDPGAAR
jgi:cobyrinic acid a,c-diamide synthase